MPVLSSVSESLLRQLSLHLRPCYFSAGEIIISKGDVGHGLYFIYDGIVSNYKITVHVYQLCIVAVGGKIVGRRSSVNC